MSNELLIELYSEEIPARMQISAAKDFEKLFAEKITKRGITCTSIKGYVTPRRLVLHVQGLPLRQDEREEERRGPRVDAASTALQGFMDATGLRLDQCEQRDTPKGLFYFAVTKKAGQDLTTLIPLILQEIVHEFPWPKSMRWAHSQRTWVRPLQSGMCVFDDKPLCFQLWMGKEQDPHVPFITFSNVSYGHRFLNPAPFEVKNFSQYIEELYQRFVILDPEKRKEIILKEGHKQGSRTKCHLRMDEGLLEEVTGLVEWPQLYLGSIDPAFMELPPEVLMTSMRVHQRYFSLETNEGNLAPYFIIVANTIPRDEGKMIIKGNERVLKARLSDAQFFFEQDQKHPFRLNLKTLNDIIFHHQLGSMKQKVDRLKELAAFFASSFKIDMDIAQDTAELLKADLVTHMVNEFPELQGTMGKYYARELLGQDHALAIEEHYQPKGSQDDLPSTDLGQLMALIDRLDTLVGFFAIGIKPTGSKDPYALRRAALGIIRLLELKKDFDLKKAIEKTYLTYQKDQLRPLDKVAQELKDFFIDRLKVYWREQGISHDIIAGAFAVGQNDSLYVLKQRCQALQQFTHTYEGQILMSAYRRASNIVRIEEQKDHISYGKKVEETLINEGAEHHLFEILKQIDRRGDEYLNHDDFTSFMTDLTTLKPAIDAFFQEVTVNAEDKNLRRNRLSLLSYFRTLFEKVADFSKIEEK